MTFDKFTIKAQQAVQEAINTATDAGQQVIEPVHLLRGIIKQGHDVTNFVFSKLDINTTQIETLIDREIAHLPKVSGGQPYLSNESNEILQKSLGIAQQMGDEYVTTETLLIALLNVNSTASRILKDSGMNDKDLRA